MSYNSNIGLYDEYSQMMASSDSDHQFQQLVEEVRPFGFEHAWEVSQYIVNNQLGHKYSALSGYLGLSNSRKSWTFIGGISPQYYAKLCRALGINDEKNPDVRVDSFTSYEDLEP
jgi:hypothetical protein